MPAGDALLRHDIQVIADHAIVTGPVTSWPLAWGPILAQIDEKGQSLNLPPRVTASLDRVRRRAQWETRTNELTLAARVRVADSAIRIRTFDDTPRESAEIDGGLSWTGKRFSATLRGQLVKPEESDSEGWADGSMLGAVFGNFSVSANTLDRWWGPGWDGSLILSNNARPIPALSLDRIFTDRFESRWLRWIGPWDFTAILGELESDRAVPNALFFGLRLTFRPLQSLEIGLSRTAQFCGDGRECDADTFLDLLLGRDNRGDAGISIENEPGNQLAGMDFRWSLGRFGLPVSLYGQLIGEDEAGGFPSRYIGQFGLDMGGMWSGSWSWRWFGEFAGTSCQFHESSELFDCAYNHDIYLTGYRYRGRSIGHGADNDARLLSMGLLLADDRHSQWRVNVRGGELNRGGAAAAGNSLTPLPQDIFSIDLAHSRALRYGMVDLGVGYERLDGVEAGRDSGSRFYIQWRSAY